MSLLQHGRVIETEKQIFRIAEVADPRTLRALQPAGNPQDVWGQSRHAGALGEAEEEEDEEMTIQVTVT